jgi:hypothetical protein
MEGDAPQFLVAPAGYINPTTPYYYPQPQITSVNPLPLEIYVSPNGSDDVAIVGSVTAPFQSITAAVLYVEQLTEFATTPIVIFVAPGTYAGGFTLSDNMYLIGATVNSSAPAVPFLQSNGIIITSSIDVTASYANDSPIVAQNIQFNAGIQVRSDLFDTSFSLVNCVLRGNGSQPTLNISPINDIFTTVSARGCEFSTDSIASTAVVRAFVFDKSTLIFDNCQFSTPGGSLIDIIGTLKANNCSFLNTTEDDALPPLIRAVSGAGQIPDVVITNSTFKYTDVTTVDTGGTKLAVEFTAGAQNINAVMTNNTMSIFLGDAQTDIVKNIGAGQVTLSQSANSCLLDGKTIDTTNLVLTTAFFLQDSPLPPPPAGGVSYLNSLEGSVTLSGGDGITVGTVGDTITVTNTGALSVAGATGAITLTGTNVAITVEDENIDLAVTFPAIPVTSVGAKTGDITFAAGLDGGLALAYGENNAAPITISNTGVITIESITGNVTLSTTTTGLTIVPTGQDIAIDVTFPVTSVNSKTGDVTFASGDGIQLDPGMDPADPIYIINSGILSVSAGTGILTETTSGATTVSAIARPYTLLGATTGGVVTNVIGIGSGNTWPATTFNLASTIQINVPPGWSGGQSVFFDGYSYYNFSSTVVSFWAIYYVTSTNPTEESLIGVKLANDSIAAPASVAQIYLPMNLTIPPTYLEDSGTITLRVYGYVTTSGEYLSSNPLIDARVGIVYP